MKGRRAIPMENIMRGEKTQEDTEEKPNKKYKKLYKPTAISSQHKMHMPNHTNTRVLYIKPRVHILAKTGALCPGYVVHNLLPTKISQRDTRNKQP